MERKIFSHPFFGEMYYLIQKPDTDESLPLIVFLHGAGERGKDFSLISVNGIPKYIEQGSIDEIPAIVVCPQCPENTIWNDNVMFLKALIDDVTEKYNVSRVSITGLSMGGYGTWAMIQRYPDFFYKAAPICGGGVAWNCRVIKTPVWAFHGDADPTVKIENAYLMIDSLKNNNGSAELTIFHGVGHNSWDHAYLKTNVIKWLTE